MYWLADGSVLSDSHRAGSCETSGACPLHDPSRHALREAPLVAYAPTGGLGRRCEHGQDHPDIDDVDYRGRNATNYVGKPPGWLHQPCDGCCGLNQSPWVKP